MCFEHPDHLSCFLGMVIGQVSFFVRVGVQIEQLKRAARDVANKFPVPLSHTFLGPPLQPHVEYGVWKWRLRLVQEQFPK